MEDNNVCPRKGSGKGFQSFDGCYALSGYRTNSVPRYHGTTYVVYRRWWKPVGYLQYIIQLNSQFEKLKRWRREAPRAAPRRKGGQEQGPHPPRGQAPPSVPMSTRREFSASLLPNW